MGTSRYGLFDITKVTNGKTRSICAENPTGGKGMGALEESAPDWASSDLGKPWKVKPCLDVAAGAKATLAEIEGPGKIEHIWITAPMVAHRDVILRMFWDGEETPSVEVPVGDFFCNGHSLRCNVNSIPIAVNPDHGFNSYWPMPFRKSARIEIENQNKDAIHGFFFQITYELDEVPADAAYFHAQWRRAVSPIDNPEHVILDGIAGKGHYVGTYLAWTQLADGWWGEGEIKFFMDGDKESPTICGTGTEDYFGGAWGFGEAYSTAFLGYPLWHHPEDKIPKHGLYRWHMLDPIRFDTDLKVTIQALGWWPNGKFQPLQDDIASVGYWYQVEPHGPFPKMLPVHLRWPR